VGFNPGGGTDLTARLVGAKLSERYGQAVIIDNRPGIGGVAARNIAAQANPDGYTLLVLSGSQVVGASLVYKNPVDMRNTFTSISQLTAYPFPLMINPSIPATTVKEMIAYMKSRPPGSLNYGSSGVASMAHLSGALLGHMVGVSMQHVPYKGSNPAIVDLIRGQIQLTFGSATAAIPLAKTGKIRILAFSSANRSQAYPDIPTVAESGLPGFDVTGWFGLIGPRGIPRSSVMTLNREIREILKHPDVVKNFAASGTDAVSSSPEELTEKIAKEESKWNQLIKATGMLVQ